MSIVLAAKETRSDQIKSLCDTCGKAFPQLCVYMDANSEGIEAALDVLKAKAVKFVSNRQKSAVYKVTECPQHLPADMPEIPKNKRESVEALNAKMAGYDIGCPHCGNVYGNGVARTGVLKVEEWFCRCGQCKKSYRPRRLIIDMTLKDDFAKALTKEKYLEMKERGLSDAQILKELDLPYNAFVGILCMAKKAWGIPGKPVAQRKGQEPQQPEPEPVPVEPQQPESEPAPEPVSVEPEPAKPETLPNDPAADNYDPRQPIADWTPEQPRPEHHQELSLIDAIKLKDQLAADVECADYLIDPETIAVDVTAGIKLVLEAYRCECAAKLKKLDDVLSRITVTI